MYRQYENPYRLEERLAELQAELAEHPDNEDIAIEIAEVKDRINFAWQDDEYECD